MPPAVFSCDSSRSTTTLSPSGCSVTLDCDLGFDLVAVAAMWVSSCKKSIGRRYRTVAGYGWIGEQTRGPRRPSSLGQTAVEPLIWAQNQPVGKGPEKQAA